MEGSVLPDAETVLASVHSDPRAAAADALRIIELTTVARERVTARWALGFAHREMADMDRADRELRAALAGAEELGDPVLAGRIMTSLALVVLTLDSPAAALTMLERAIDLLDGADRARAVMQRGLVHYRVANFDDALRDHLAAVADLRAAGDWVALARLHVNLGSIQAFRRQFDAAEESLTDAIDMSELSGQALLAGGAHHNLGHLRALRGDVPGALREFDTAMARYEQLAAPNDRVASLMADRARSLSDAGLRAEAIEAVDVAYELIRRDSHDADAADIALLAASIRLEGGEASRAVDPAAWARAIYSMQDRSAWVPLAELVLLRARIHEPDIPRAQEGRQLARALEELGWVEEAQTALIFSSDLFLRAGALAGRGRRPARSSAARCRDVAVALGAMAGTCTGPAAGR